MTTIALHSIAVIQLHELHLWIRAWYLATLHRTTLSLKSSCKLLKNAFTFSVLIHCHWKYWPIFFHKNTNWLIYFYSCGIYFLNHALIVIFTFSFSGFVEIICLQQYFIILQKHLFFSNNLTINAYRIMYKMMMTL